MQVNESGLQVRGHLENQCGQTAKLNPRLVFISVDVLGDLTDFGLKDFQNFYHNLPPSPVITLVGSESSLDFPLHPPGLNQNIKEQSACCM